MEQDTKIFGTLVNLVAQVQAYNLFRIWLRDSVCLVFRLYYTTCGLASKPKIILILNVAIIVST